MTLGEIIRQYRDEHSISMDTFARQSGMSKQYISILEKNCHPKTGKPVIPSITMINKAAAGMGMSFDSLFAMIDGDVRIDPVLPLTSSDLTSEEQSIIHSYRTQPDAKKDAICDILHVKREETKRLSDSQAAAG